MYEILRMVLNMELEYGKNRNRRCVKAFPVLIFCFGGLKYDEKTHGKVWDNHTNDERCYVLELDE